VLLNAESSATATFAAAVAGGGGGGGGAAGGGGGGGAASFTLSVSRSNLGTVVSDLAGINCGSACSTKYAAGTTVTLSAVPAAGTSFLGWTGACTNAAGSCTVTLNADTKAQANFSK
jgi:hypothetical protein